MNSIKLSLYTLILALVVFIDRITKFYALNNISDIQKITSFLSCNLVMNRGIACGLFNSSESSMFICVSLLVIGIYCLLGVYTVFRYKNNQSIVGEMLVLSGGFSNIIDRFVFQGVLDFIVFSYKGWAWPVFNVADAAIVLGVVVMIFLSFFEL